MPCTCGEFSSSPVLPFYSVLGSLQLVLKTLLVFWVFAALVQSWRWVGHVWLDSTPLQLTRRVFPLFFPQKDLLLSEIPSSTTRLCSSKTDVEKVMAKEICQNYLEKRAGRLPEACAEALAMAACLCLRRRNASLAEVSLTFSLPPAVSPVLRQQDLNSPAAWVCFTRGSVTIPLPMPLPRSDFIHQGHICLQTAVSAGAPSSQTGVWSWGCPGPHPRI